MKKLVIFFLFLCVHLAGGYQYAHAIDHHGKISCKHSGDTEQTHHVESADVKHDYLLTRQTGLAVTNDFLISVEDNDENELLVKKNKSLARQFLAFYYTFVLNQRSSGLTDNLPFHQHLSHTGSSKYIVQRTLRI
jgi:hypothetical protein